MLHAQNLSHQMAPTWPNCCIELHNLELLHMFASWTFHRLHKLTSFEKKKINQKVVVT
jgi:hypothetical protein